VLVTELKGGTLTSSAESMCSLPVRPADLALCVGEGLERMWVMGEVVGTLLGPEGTGRLLVAGRRCGVGL
jgi:hypothetical protein